MNDLVLVAVWAAVLLAGLGFCVALRAAGVPVTHLRDLLHVGAGVWVVGWRGWSSPVVPTALTVLVFLATLAATRVTSSRVRSAISDSNERWSGIVLYAFSFAVLTAIGLTRSPFEAAAALLALALGDGVGGAIGVRFGRHRFQIGHAKPKSVEGCLGVWLFASLGIWMASVLFGADPGLAPIVLGGLVAAVAEALAPRASDNVFVPAAVFAVLTGLP